MFGFNFAPVSWATCDGQIMSIAQNTALFSLLGTQYGGNGTSTFALPDLRSRVPIHMGQGPGLSSYVIGQQAGSESTTLLSSNLPAHTHPFAPPCSTDDPSSGNPKSNFPASVGTAAFSASSNAVMGTAQTGVNSGGPIPFNNVQPYLTINFSICLQGIFPSRN